MSFFEHDRRAGRFWASLVLIGCAFGLLADFALYATGHWHGHGFPGLYALIGFVAYCCIVYSAKGLRVIASRDEVYYGEAQEHDRSVNGERSP